MAASQMLTLAEAKRELAKLVRNTRKQVNTLRAYIRYLEADGKEDANDGL